MSKPDNIFVFHWQAWDNFLISHLVADYCHAQIDYDDDIHTLERFLTPNIRAVLFQINLSHSQWFPVQRQQIIAALKARGIVVLNTEIEDISKRHLHTLLEQAGLRSAKASQSGPADQVLFIKSNLNWGGGTERGRLQALPAALQQRLLPQPAGVIQAWDQYYTAQRGDIDSQLWQEPALVIENHITNHENSFFRVIGFGDALVVVKAYTPALIKKISGHPLDRNIFLTRQQILSQKTTLPPDLQTQLQGFIRHYPLAYFCLDIVHDGHQHTIIDLNLTPWGGTSQQASAAADFLCDGAYQFLKQQRSG
jgi:hypothetical protein